MLEFKPAVNKNLIERVVEYYKLSSEEQIPYVVIEKNLLREFLIEVNKFAESNRCYKLAITSLDDITDMFSYQVIGINDENEIIYQSNTYLIRKLSTYEILSDICSGFIKSNIFTIYQCTTALYNLLGEDTTQGTSSSTNGNFTLIKKGISSILYANYINMKFEAINQNSARLKGYDFSIDETYIPYWCIQFFNTTIQEGIRFKVNTTDIQLFLAGICKFLNKLSSNDDLQHYGKCVTADIRKFLTIIKYGYMDKFKVDGFDFPEEIFKVFDVPEL